MAKKIKNKTIALVTALMCATNGMGVISANAATSASFSVSSSANYPGAPSNTGNTGIITIRQRAAGVKATVSGYYNSDGSNEAGTTHFDCMNYYMARVSITGIGTATLQPSIGNPVSNIQVAYKVSASTSRPSNIYTAYVNLLP